MSGRDDLREQIAAALYEAEARRLGYGSPLPDCVDPQRWLDSADALLPLVGAQVETARRDTHAGLWTWGDVLKAKAEGQRDAWDEGFRHARDGKDDGVGLLSDNPYRDRAARGETRQPCAIGVHADTRDCTLECDEAQP